MKQIKVKHDYSKEFDIFSVYWRDSNKQKVKYSEEVQTEEGHNFVVDYDTKGRIVGVEIFDWNRTNGKSKKKRKKK